MIRPSPVRMKIRGGDLSTKSFHRARYWQQYESRRQHCAFCDRLRTCHPRPIDLQPCSGDMIDGLRRSDFTHRDRSFSPCDARIAPPSWPARSDRRESNAERCLKNRGDPAVEPNRPKAITFDMLRRRALPCRTVPPASNEQFTSPGSCVMPRTLPKSPAKAKMSWT
jgi:hypothetical protein